MTKPTVNAKPTLGLVEFVMLMACMTSLIALSIDAMLPALDVIGQELGARDSHESHLIVSLFFGGMAFGQLFFGPFCDARGRRQTIIYGTVIFVLGTLVCVMARDLNTMLLGRLIQAFGVSGPRIASMAVIRDQFAGEAMAKVMSFIMMVFILVPMVAPMVGQWVLNIASWRHIFTLFLVVSCSVGVWYFIRQPETLLPKDRVPFSVNQFFLSSKYIMTHRDVIGPTIAMGCVFGAFLAYISASQTIFVGFYQVGDLFAYVFAFLAFAIGLASFMNSRFVMRWGMKNITRLALMGVLTLSAILVAEMLLFEGLPPLPLLLVTLFIEFFFVGLLFGNLNAIAMLPLGKMAGVGAAIIGSLSSVISVPIALIIDAFLANNLYPIAIGFMLFFSVATVVITPTLKQKAA